MSFPQLGHCTYQVETETNQEDNDCKLVFDTWLLELFYTLIKNYLPLTADLVTCNSFLTRIYLTSILQHSQLNWMIPTYYMI